MTALLLDPVEELVALAAPPAWLRLPNDWRDGLAYWALVQAVTMQKNVLPVGPPRNVDWTFAHEPKDLEAIVLRHPCEECEAAITEATEKLAAEPNQVIAVAQFTVDYLRTPQQMAGSPERVVYRREG